VDVEGEAGDFTVSLRQEPRYVDPAHCTSCGLCAQVCPVELPNTYQLGMTMRKAAYKVAARPTDAFFNRQRTVLRRLWKMYRGLPDWSDRPPRATAS
jgi:heterodisulfide reductase subunit A-like polyferredoxin